MQTQLRTAVLAAIAAVAIASTALAAPTAKQYQSTLTSPTTATGATISITKPSKIIAKISPGNFTLQLKLGGVVDALSAPANVTGNTMQVDVVIGNSLFTLMNTFNIVNGKVSQKFTTADSSLPGGGLSTGQTIEIRGVRLIQGGNFNTFAVAGLTAK